MSKIRVAVAVLSCLTVAPFGLAQLPQAATPIFSQPGGTYNNQLTVGLSDATPGAVIYYTINGATPTAASTRYAGPQTLRQSMTVSAIAYAPGYAASNSVSETFSFVAVAPAFSLAAGAYLTPQTLKITSATSTAKIFYTLDGSYPTTSSPIYSAPLALSSSKWVRAMACETGFQCSSITTAQYHIGETTVTPVFSPRGESVSTSLPVIVTITDATPGAFIHYTIDGSTPTPESPGYTAPITITATTTLRALAFAHGYQISPVVSNAYVLEDVYNEVGFGPFRTVSYDGPIGDGGPPVDASLDAWGMAFDQAGNFYVADHNANRIRKVSVSDGLISTFAGTGPYLYAPGAQRYGSYSGDGGLATDAGLSWPTGVAIDSKGNVFFSDTGNDVVRRVDAVTGIITTVVGTPSLGGGYSGDGGPAAEATLYAPYGLIFDPSDNLYIADTGNSVIRKVDAGTGIITTVAGKQYLTGTPYQSTYCHYSGDGGAATSAELCQPNAIALDAQQNLYISDSQNNVIRMVSSTTGKISTFAGAKSAFYNPTALAFDQAGNLFIADSYLIYKVPAGTGTVTWFTGSDNFIDGLPRTLTQVLFPRGVVFDSAGNLYFSQSENYYSGVRKISLSATPTPLF